MQLILAGILICSTLALVAAVRAYYWWRDSDNPTGISAMGLNMRERLSVDIKINTS